MSVKESTFLITGNRADEQHSDSASGFRKFTDVRPWQPEGCRISEFHFHKSQFENFEEGGEITISYGPNYFSTKSQDETDPDRADQTAYKAFGKVRPGMDPTHLRRPSARRSTSFRQGEEEGDAT